MNVFILSPKSTTQTTTTLSELNVMLVKISTLIASIDRLTETLEKMQDQRKNKVCVNDALSLLITVGPNVSEIARRLGVNRRVLYRPEFSVFIEALEVARDSFDSQRRVVRGHVVNGNIEAWTDTECA